MDNGKDHDLLIEISSDIKGIREDLKRGSLIMSDHEMRLRVQERCATDFVKRDECQAAHKTANNRMIWLLGILLVASLALGSALIVELAKK